MQMNLSYEDTAMLWNDVVEMAHDCDDPSMLPWLERLAPVSLENGIMTVSTRQNWTVRKIVREYRPVIERLLSDITLEPIALNVIVAGTAGAGPSASQHDAQSGHAAATPAAGAMFHVKHPGNHPATEPTQNTDQAAEPADVQTTDQVAEQQPSPAAMAGAAVAAGRMFTQRIPRPPAAPVKPNTLAPEESGGAGASAAEQPEPLETGSAFTPPVRGAVLAEPEVIEQDAVVPILEDGTIPKSAVNSGYSDFSFDTYIVGEANKLAFNMAQTVAEQPGSVGNLNPLFIWGPSGNGKTHLLLSISNYLHDHQPNMNVQYVPANAFVDQYIDDIRNKRLRGKEVLKAYRAVDVLLVDDVQFFEDKQESVSTFFDIFNQLILDGKQIVLVADTPPDYLSLDDRMRTRFGSGLVVDIKAPTYEMKRSILLSYYERCRERMDWCNVEIPTKLFDIMAQLAPDNPRNMQGLMTSIMIKANDDPSVLSSDGIKTAVKDLFKTTDAVSVPAIIRVVTDAYGVTADDVKGKSRTKIISEARQVVMWMARQLTDESYENIGAELGGRDHSTVYYGISTIEKRSTEDKSYLYKLERLKKEIMG